MLAGMPRPPRLKVTAAVIFASVAAITASGAMADDHAAPACGPASARTIAADTPARVYATAGEAYGCVRGETRAYLLGTTGDISGVAHIETVRVAGHLVAYGLRTNGVDTGHVTINLRDLGPGTLIAQRPATTRIGIEGFQSIESLVLKADGSLAWISTARSIGKPTFVRQLLRLDRQGFRVLDSGPDLDATSLALDGSIITWDHGANARSATLR